MLFDCAGFFLCIFMMIFFLSLFYLPLVLGHRGVSHIRIFSIFFIAPNVCTYFCPCLCFQFFSKFLSSFKLFYYCFMCTSVFFYVFSLQIFYATSFAYNSKFHLSSSNTGMQFFAFSTLFPTFVSFIKKNYFCNVYYC